MYFVEVFLKKSTLIKKSWKILYTLSFYISLSLCIKEHKPEEVFEDGKLSLPFNFILNHFKYHVYTLVDSLRI